MHEYFMRAAAALAVTTLMSAAAQGQTIVGVVDLAAVPILDGDGSEWSAVAPTTVALRNNRPGGESAVESVEVRAGTHGDEVFLLLRWKDATADTQHKPFVWSDAEGKYVDSGRKEDRLAVQFAMSGEYTTDWFSGATFSADMWHWKAHRSNELGLAHDKMTKVGKDPVKKAYKATARDGSALYITRPGDRGDKLYKSKRYIEKAQPEMPKYILNPQVSGSVADVKAKGVWRDGMWTLELRRKLDTGNDDDVVFTRGQEVAAGIAVFDRTGDDDHNMSEVLAFRF